jgi:hypothetical protein
MVAWVKMCIRGTAAQRITVMLLCLAGQAWGHDFWIEPASFRPAVNERVPITLRVGMDFSGTSQPLVPQWFSDYSVTAPSGTEPVLGMIGDDPAGSFAPAEAGLHMVGYRSNNAFVEIPPQKFNDYLRDEGLEWVIDWRAERGLAETNARELYARCAKALVLAGDGGPASGFDRPLGYTLELIPESNPYALTPGDALPVRLLYEGQPLPNVLIIAFTAEEPDVKQRARTGADGRVSLRVDRAGTWLIKGVHIISTDDPINQATWQSYWASLTFRLAAG